MKRIILFLLVLFFVCKMNAQSMLEGNPVWTYYSIQNHGSEKNLLFGKYYLSGTIDIEGKTYHKMYLDVYNGKEFLESKYQVGLREEDGRVYVNLEEFKTIDPDPYMRYCSYELTSDGELILYDFNMKEGDIIPFYINNVLADGTYDKVKTRYEVKMNDGSTRDMLEFSSVWNGKEEISENPKILCGIGSLDSYGTLLTHRSHYVIPKDDDYMFKSHLNLFFQNGTLVYRAPDDGSEVYQTYKDDPFFPETVGMSRDIIFDNVTDDAAIYDLSGRRLSSFPERGIYIRGGKKFWVR